MSHVHDHCTDHDTLPAVAATSGIQRGLLRAIYWYQKAREGRPSPCRFWPSCSEYAVEAISVHGSGR